MDHSKVKTLKGGKSLSYYRQHQKLIRGFDNFYVRFKHATAYSWPILTKEALNYLAMHLRGKKVIDLFCGGGLLAYELRKRRINIVNNDLFDIGPNDYYRRIRQHTPIDIYSGAESIDLRDYDVIVMSWIPYRSEAGTEVLRRMRSGQIVVIQGEWEGGCTADDSFFEVLKKDFKEDITISGSLDNLSVSFYGIHDRWYWYVKT